MEKENQDQEPNKVEDNTAVQVITLILSIAMVVYALSVWI